MGKQEYVLRHVIGKHFLVCVSQCDKDYIPPIELNEVGAFIWERYRAGEPVQEVSRLLSEEYRISQQEAESDVTEFLKELQKQGCI